MSLCTGQSRYHQSHEDTCSQKTSIPVKSSGCKSFVLYRYTGMTRSPHSRTDTTLRQRVGLYRHRAIDAPSVIGVGRIRRLINIVGSVGIVQPYSACRIGHQQVSPQYSSAVDIQPCRRSAVADPELPSGINPPVTPPVETLQRHHA